ncbi:unnamed protein product [Anisakis simplex]|uniref:SERPIN domain-containing protein n=1 Tax=Anisakis simplex TaxID=6269 RepID=A0A0M3KCD8_ANISI|nr:unnamed protein product [Anisakis simplex]
MTYAGAGGDTYVQMNRILAGGESNEAFEKYFRTILEGIENKPERDSFSIGPAFQLDTANKIKDLVRADMFNKLTSMVLVNAIYFNGSWLNPFEDLRTKKKTFYQAADSTREVEMMFNDGYFPYYENDKVQVLGLPYEGYQVYMYVFLPKDKYGLEEFEKSLKGEELLKLISETNSMDAIVELPKFKIEEEFQLVKALKKIGIVDAFDKDANFSGILYDPLKAPSDNKKFIEVELPILMLNEQFKWVRVVKKFRTVKTFGDNANSNGNSDVPLQISDVIHKAFFEVNEKGTEAAAATAIITNRITSLEYIRPRPPPVRFIADHPFMFALVKSNTILFIGHYY